MTAAAQNIIAYQGCMISPPMAASLLAHLREPQPLPRSGMAMRAVRALLDRAWLCYRPGDHGKTMLTASGRPAALKVRSRLVPAAAEDGFEDDDEGDGDLGGDGEFDLLEVADKCPKEPLGHFYRRGRCLRCGKEES